MKTSIATNTDIQGVLDLQKVNLYKNLTEEQRKSGFVTTPFTKEQLQELVASNGLFALKVQGKIKGYTMAASWDYFAQWAIFPFMLGRLKGNKYNGIEISASNSYQYGPVCIANDLRGSNAFPLVFEEMRLEMTKRYPIGITFINQVNQRSYQAHIKRLNMNMVDKFKFSGRNYYGLAFDSRNTVLTAFKKK